MALRFRLPKPSFAFFLQAAACAVVAWSVWDGGLTAPRTSSGTQPASAESTPDSAASNPFKDAGTATAPTPAAPDPAGTPAGSVASPAAPASGAGVAVQLAGATGFDGARLALTSIDVIVSRNDTLDRIFRRLKLSLADLASLRALPGLKTHLDSLRPGESLHFMHRDGELFGLERRLNDAETLEVTRAGDGLKANVVANPLETRTHTVGGRISSSLFEAVGNSGAHDQTAVALADIFGWDIDFVLDVRPGDSFVVTYQEIWRDGHYLKDGPVLAASFVNQGREYRAVRYTDPTGITSYYAPDGHSMRKAFLRAPLEFSRVSSGFNSARLHPILNRIRAHKGVDYAAPTGTPVRAAGDGVIRFAGVMGGYGNLIEIEHTHSITTVYGHLSHFVHGMRAGTHVSQGTVIAYVGMTGLATGPHLHYEYRVNGVFKNPQTVVLPAATPINASYSADFHAHTDPLLQSLDPAAGPMLVAR
ncbi:MAG TPA: peptidoglycan DD-metalloendopeptidase family protein [Steroidobacteraceae bacterium]|nr:peptidoglycan DD-metalloendopeptidase family protein [Steroidobacteraceae bacterium]